MEQIPEAYSLPPLFPPSLFISAFPIKVVASIFFFLFMAPLAAYESSQARG